MRKALAAAIVLFSGIVSAPALADTFSPNFHLVIPSTGSAGWGIKLNNDLIQIDTTVASIAASTGTINSAKSSTGTCVSPNFPRVLSSGGLTCAQPSDVTGTALTITGNLAGYQFNGSTYTAAIALKQNAFTGISSACASGQYMSSGTWANGVLTGGGCVATLVGTNYVLKAGDTMTGALTVTGTSVTASSFFGDGSHLTGISAGESNTYTSSKTFTNSAFSVGASTFVVTGGRVGIGTTNPQGPLDVTGSIYLSSAGTNQVIVQGTYSGLILGEMVIREDVNGDQVQSYAKTMSFDGTSGMYFNHPKHYLGNPGDDVSTTVVTGRFSIGKSGDSLIPRAYLDNHGDTLLDGPASITTISSTMTVQGNAFSVGGSTFVITGGRVGIGTTNVGYTMPTAILDISGPVSIESPSSNALLIGSGTYAGSNALGPYIQTMSRISTSQGPALEFQHGRGTTLSTVTAQLAGDSFGEIRFQGWDGAKWSNNNNGVKFQAKTINNWSTTDNSGKFTIYVTTSGAIQQQAVIGSDGNGGLTFGNAFFPNAVNSFVSGNVGIGTTSPDKTLSVAGAANFKVATSTFGVGGVIAYADYTTAITTTNFDATDVWFSTLTVPANTLAKKGDCIVIACTLGGGASASNNRVYVNGIPLNNANTTANAGSTAGPTICYSSPGHQANTAINATDYPNFWGVATTTFDETQPIVAACACRTTASGGIHGICNFISEKITYAPAP